MVTQATPAAVAAADEHDKAVAAAAKVEVTTGLRITIRGVTADFWPDRITFAEAQQVRRATGAPMEYWRRLEVGGEDQLAVFIWFTRCVRGDEPALTVDAVYESLQKLSGDAARAQIADPGGFDQDWWFSVEEVVDDLSGGGGDPEG
jgi:hypothetical protein